MNIVVLIKQVPDTYSERKLNASDGILDRGATDAVTFLSAPLSRAAKSAPPAPQPMSRSLVPGCTFSSASNLS